MTETAVSEKAPVSYMGEVIADNSGKFVGNQLRFATEEEAQWYVDDLFMRWTLCREKRVVPSQDPVTDRYERDEDGRLSSVRSKVES